MLFRLLPLLLLLALPALGDPFSGVQRSGSDPFAEAPRFLPVEEAYRPSVRLDHDDQLSLHWDIADGYYLYRHRLGLRWLEQPEHDPEAGIPPGLAKTDEFFGDVEVFYHSLEIPFRAPAAEGSWTLVIDYQGCADAGLCYPPETRYVRVQLPAGDIEWLQAAPTTAPTAGLDGGVSQWLLMAGFALLGGILLNLMPCVFPVLSLKVLAFANDRDHHLGAHGLSYAAGVVLSFLVVAALLIALTRAGTAAGWGFQLQTTWFVGALAYLFLLLGLNLSGFWTLGGSWVDVGGRLAGRSGYSGSFFTGVLAAVVASPCTAPLMGAALGYAVTQPPASALLIFAALGLGMALPLTALCFAPGLLRRLPRPGPWMERLRQFLAFPLYATAIWLLWVVGQQAGVDALAALLAGSLLLVLALWLWPLGLGGRCGAAIATALALSLLASPLLTARPAVDGATDARRYSPQRLAELRQRGEPVFINVTADWCITCLANERSTLSTRRVQQAFRDHGVHYLKADWTRPDPDIAELLASFGRNSIPLYIYYPRGSGTPPQLLPQWLTPGLVLDLLDSDTPGTSEFSHTKPAT